MVLRRREGALTNSEKRIAKALLAKGWRNQDIQALVNTGRAATINSARITGVKQDNTIRPAPDEAVEFFRMKKQAFDPQTGLNRYDDERLIRAREAIALAVQTFNSPTLKFKTEVFAVLANIAWTYLLHEFYDRKRVPIKNENGMMLLLSQMLDRNDCPLSAGMKQNLLDLKTIRDDVEHRLFGRADVKWLPLFQACCLNFEKMICELFGNELSLRDDLGFALQFAKLNLEQLSELNRFEIPQNIEALDARLREALTEELAQDLEYQFRVVFTLDSASKSRAHMEFLHPDSEQAEQVRNVLVKYKAADEYFPFKPNAVVQLVRVGSGRPFNSRNHVQAWKLFKARPVTESAQPENTNKDYCIYHAAHGDYTYSQKWVDFLIGQMAADASEKAIKSFRP